jgi:hypothetical protein
VLLPRVVFVKLVAVPTQAVVELNVELGLAKVAVVPPKFNVNPDDDVAVKRSIKIE